MINVTTYFPIINQASFLNEDTVGEIPTTYQVESVLGITLVRSELFHKLWNKKFPIKGKVQHVHVLYMLQENPHYTNNYPVANRPFREKHGECEVLGYSSEGSWVSPTQPTLLKNLIPVGDDKSSLIKPFWGEYGEHAYALIKMGKETHLVIALDHGLSKWTPTYDKDVKKDEYRWTHYHQMRVNDFKRIFFNPGVVNGFDFNLDWCGGCRTPTNTGSLTTGTCKKCMGRAKKEWKERKLERKHDKLLDKRRDALKAGNMEEAAEVEAELLKMDLEQYHSNPEYKENGITFDEFRAVMLYSHRSVRFILFKKERCKLVDGRWMDID